MDRSPLTHLIDILWRWKSNAIICDKTMEREKDNGYVVDPGIPGR